MVTNGASPQLRDTNELHKWPVFEQSSAVLRDPEQASKCRMQALSALTESEIAQKISPPVAAMMTTTTTILDGVQSAFLPTPPPPPQAGSPFTPDAGSEHMQAIDNPHEDAAGVSKKPIEPPECGESIEMLEFLEFRQDAAKRLLARFRETISKIRAVPPKAATAVATTTVEPMSMSAKPTLHHPGRSLCAFALGHLDSFPVDAVRELDDWVGILLAMGMSEKFIRRVMDPKHARWRLRGTAKEWAKMAVEERFFYLENYKRWPEADAETLNRGQPPFSLGTQRRAGEVERGHQVFFKGGTLVRMMSVFNGDYLLSSSNEASSSSPSSSSSSSSSPGQSSHSPISTTATTIVPASSATPSGALNFFNLMTPPPGDFAMHDWGLYLTEQFDVAWDFAQWAAVVVDGATVPIAVLRVAIPDAALEGGRGTYRLSDRDEWHRFAWLNLRYDKPEPEFARIDASDWILGPLVLQSPEAVLHMKHMSEMTPWYLRDGTTANQIFTANKGVILAMGAEWCRGRVRVDRIDVGELRWGGSDGDPGKKEEEEEEEERDRLDARVAERVAEAAGAGIPRHRKRQEKL